MKHLRYLKYVLRHKWFVFLACCRLGIPWRGIVHDLSKFRWSEWNAYVNWFYTDHDVDVPKLDNAFVDQPNGKCVAIGATLTEAVLEAGTRLGWRKDTSGNSAG